MRGKVLVVGISGVSNGGKTTTALHLKQKLESRFAVHIIHQDDYYKEDDEIAVDPTNGLLQWDVIEAFHIEKLSNDVHQKIKELKSKYEKSILIIEGIILYTASQLNALFDKRFLFTLPYSEARRRRDLREYIPADVPGLFDQHVWPMYEEYRNSVLNSNFKVTEIDGQKSQSEIFDFLIGNIIENFS